MKIALVHDYLKEYGGAERVLETLHEVWPDAPVYTAFVDYEGLGPHAARIREWDIRTSWVQKVWPVKKLHSPLRFLAPLVWESFDFTGFDVVITSSAWYIPRGIVTRPETLHICYLHTPPRHLYGYETAIEWRRFFPLRIYARLVNHYLRMYDYLTAQRVDSFIANSKETKRRISKFYRRNSTVIYPPVVVPFIAQGHKKQYSQSVINHTTTGEYYLCVSRLARAKHIDLAIKACQELGEPLVIVGKGRDEERLKSLVKESRIKNQESRIIFLGELSDEELWEIYAGARALIFPASDEEFGIVPVEAMAAGIPVIAYRSGGVVETVVEGETGVFFDELSVDSLIEAINRLNKVSRKHKNTKAQKHESTKTQKAGKQIEGITADKCRRQAQKFSKERFKDEIENFVLDKAKQLATQGFVSYNC